MWHAQADSAEGARARAERLECGLRDCVTAADSQVIEPPPGDEYRRGQARGALDALEMVRRAVQRAGVRL
jgi:hypothetical protein